VEVIERFRPLCVVLTPIASFVLFPLAPKNRPLGGDSAYFEKHWFSIGRKQLFISGGGAIFMKLGSMISSRLFNRGTTFSQTVTNKFLFATFPKMRTFSFNQDADRVIRTE